MHQRVRQEFLRGSDAVIVSNHGGRNEETLRSTIECLPEVSAAVAGRVPVVLDGGIVAAPMSSRRWRSVRPRWE
jgi:isopentenyl diphosphate isomerase/L-lactate dehydrogenase-like FMN-dependent dehydrogenase